MSGVRVHPAIDRPDSVTHYVCEAGEQREHLANVTHHMNANGRCRYCGQLRSDLAAAIRAEAARG